jgi:ATP-dependent 26S proteasome regulatory subunit
LFQKYQSLFQIDDDIDFERVAQSAVNFSGSDLKEVCRLAVLRRAKDLIDTEDDMYEFL